MMKESEPERRKRLIAKLVSEHPDEVMDALLERSFWPRFLRANDEYRRHGDDDTSYLRIVFSGDGDACPNVYHVEQVGDPRNPLSTPRYRTHFGGGESLRTRRALLILARAIALDNEQNPQRRPR